MPTYSYRCTECSIAFDIQQDFTDDSLTVCPTCDGRLRKLFSAVGVSFKGPGFYRTDSRAPRGADGSKAHVPAGPTVSEKSTSGASEKSAGSSEKSSSSSDSGSSSSGTNSSGSSASGSAGSSGSKPGGSEKKAAATTPAR